MVNYLGFVIFLCVISCNLQAQQSWRSGGSRGLLSIQSFVWKPVWGFLFPLFHAQLTQHQYAWHQLSPQQSTPCWVCYTVFQLRIVWSPSGKVNLSSLRSRWRYHFCLSVIKLLPAYGTDHYQNSYLGSLGHCGDQSRFDIDRSPIPPPPPPPPNENFIFWRIDLKFCT